MLHFCFGARTCQLKNVCLLLFLKASLEVRAEQKSRFVYSPGKQEELLPTDDSSIKLLYPDHVRLSLVEPSEAVGVADDDNEEEEDSEEMSVEEEVCIFHNWGVGFNDLWLLLRGLIKHKNGIEKTKCILKNPIFLESEAEVLQSDNFEITCDQGPIQ